MQDPGRNVASALAVAGLTRALVAEAALCPSHTA